MSRYRHLRTRAYDSLPAQIAMRKALESVTEKEVRNLLAIGLKSEEELNPNFPATGELSGSEKAPNHRPNCDGTSPDGERAVVARRAEIQISQSAQPPLLTLNHVFSEVVRRFGL